MKTTYCIIILLFFKTFSFAQQEEITTTAQIKNIVVYIASAEINYEKEVSLSAGSNTIVFTDLTPYIAKNTISISVSDPEVEIVTVTEKINYLKQNKINNSQILKLKDSLSHVNNELGLLRCKTETLAKEKELLFKDEAIGGVAKGVSIEQIKKASEFFNERYLELSMELFKLHEIEKVLLEYSESFKNQINELSTNTSQSGSEIRVVVNSTTAKKVNFSFKFLTPNAGWEPVYDCKFKGSELPLDFIFRASVFNTSGTSWENVAIKLSTANPTKAFDKPELDAFNKNGMHYKTIDAPSIIAEFDVKHKYSIPSDSKPYLLDVNTYTINAGFYYLLIPKIDPMGFLIATISGWTKYNLISGTTNIYNKGSYMGKTFLNTTTNNDTLYIFLGKDNNVQAVRKEIENNNNTIIGNYYTEKKSIDISVKNNSSERLNIQILDQVPIFNEHEKVKFDIENIEQAIYNKEEGSLTWKLELKPTEIKNIDYKYEIKAPRNTTQKGTPKYKYSPVKCPSF